MTIMRIAWAVILFCCIIMPLHYQASGETPPDRYRVTFLLGSAKIKHGGIQAVLKNGDYIKEGDILFIDAQSMVELAPLSSDARFKITGPIIYRCSGLDTAKDMSRNDLMYRLFSKLKKSTYHYYPRTVVSGVRGEKDSETDARNKRQSDALQEAIDMVKKDNLDEAWNKFEKLAQAEGLQKHVQYLINFYKAEILFSRMEYTRAMDLYLSVYKTHNRKFKHREITHCKAILCSVYTGKPDIAKKLITEYEEAYGPEGSYMPLLKELQSQL